MQMSVMNQTAVVTERPEIVSNKVTLAAFLEVLNRVDDDQLTRCSDTFPSSTIGKHIRHVIDFYRCFLDGRDDGRIDYDARPRDVGLETDRLQQLDALAGLESDLSAIADLKTGLQIVSICEDGALSRSRSTVARELVFLHSHSTHHLAIVVMLMRELGLETEAGWGLAPSTRLFLENS